MINSVGQAFADQLDLEALIDRLGDQLREVFSADIVYIALHDEATDLIEFPYFSEGGVRNRDQASLPFGQGFVSRIVVQREPLLLNRAEAFRELGVEVIGTPANSYLGVPILVGGPRDRRDQRAEHHRRRDGSARATRGCCRRSRPTSASRSRTRACTGRRNGARARWPPSPSSGARSAACSISTR